MFIAHLHYTDKESREPVSFKLLITLFTYSAICLYFDCFIHRKSTQLDSSVQRGHRVVTFGDVPLSKCYFLRKYIVLCVWFPAKYLL